MPESWKCDQCGKTARDQPNNAVPWCANTALHTPKKNRKMKEVKRGRG